MILFVNSIAHFLVDAISVTTLFSGSAAGETLTLAVILYNTLAFSTQCLVGLLVDKYKHYLHFDAAAMALVILGFALPLPYFARVILVSLGNNFFHVAAGTMTLTKSRGQAWQLGVFVAPGAFGVTLGTCFPHFGWWLCTVLALCATAAIYVWPRTPQTLELRCEETENSKFPVCIVVLLTVAVAVRAVGGTAVSFPWKAGVGMSFLMTAFVFAGKALGGFVCDQLGAAKTAWVSIPLAAVCIAFFSAYAVPSLLGQLLLNLTMPVTLWLLYRAMPEEPAFAFGLAASALWPGTIAGMLFQLTGPALWVCVIGSFVFGLFAILYSTKILHIERKE